MRIPDLLLNARYNDRYFDVVDALSEAKHIHIGSARIIERVKAVVNTVNTVSTVNTDVINNVDTDTDTNTDTAAVKVIDQSVKSVKSAQDHGRKTFRIGETGFGVGRLLVALLSSLEEGRVEGAEIEYYSVELYPVAVERMERVLGIFGDRVGVGGHIRSVVDAYSRLDVAAPGWHAAVISGGYGVVRLNLYVGEALDMVESLGVSCDAWFLDGHAPKKNPDIWRPELMASIGRKTAAGGTATAFTVAGHVRRALSAAGFAVGKVGGCGGKKEALLGVFRGV